VSTALYEMQLPDNNPTAIKLLNYYCLKSMYLLANRMFWWQRRQRISAQKFLKQENGFLLALKILRRIETLKISSVNISQRVY